MVNHKYWIEQPLPLPLPLLTQRINENRKYRLQVHKTTDIPIYMKKTNAYVKREKQTRPERLRWPA